MVIRLIRSLLCFQSLIPVQKTKVRIFFDFYSTTRGNIPESDIKHQRAILMNKYNKVRKSATTINHVPANKKLNSIEYSKIISNNATNPSNQSSSVISVRPHRKSYVDPESLENIELFIKEIKMLGMKTPGYKLALTSRPNSTVTDRSGSSSGNIRHNSTSPIGTGDNTSLSASAAELSEELPYTSNICSITKYPAPIP